MEKCQKLYTKLFQGHFFAFSKMTLVQLFSVRSLHRLAYMYELTEILNSQLVHNITTKCVLYTQVAPDKIVRQKVTVTH